MVNLLNNDTIAAIATAPGRGALATIRVSGRDAHRICSQLLHPWPADIRRATLSEVRDSRSGETIDQVIAVVYEAPHSYTGEAMVELTGHGGILSPAALLSALLERGARHARPGEFTQRAVLNGKLDLVQAESIADVVDAKTEAMRRAALFHLDGSLSQRIAGLRERLLELESLIAYEIDFPEEDDGPVPRARVEQALRQLFDGLDGLLATASMGEVIREGAVVVIAGRPNVGKSSLFNALLGYRRAIVTEIPGTTRDALEAVIEGDRWPIRLVDTAGLRESPDVIEREGVEISRRYLRGAHVALLCEDDPSRLATQISTLRGLASSPIVAVATKCDSGEADYTRPDVSGAEAYVRTSAVTREGLAELVEAVQKVLDRQLGTPNADVPLVLRARQRSALEQARMELQSFADAWRDEALPIAIAAIHVRTAAHVLEELIGAVDIEDVLARVFASFCIGK